MGDLPAIKAASENPDASGSPSSITVARWQRVKEVFGLALDCEPGNRSVLLREACEGDNALFAEVWSLLVAAQGTGAETSDVFKAVSPEEHATTSAEDFMLGRRIGDYRIERRIGYGGMAAVYLASRADEQFQMLAAIKLLRPDPDREDLLQRFLNERQTLAALTHPNIVKLLDGGNTEEGLPYLVMDYVDGVPIDEYCDSHNLSIPARLEMFVKVCRAVEYAHAHSVIHRDLKPSNILVTMDGTPKLLDFGIAKVLDTANSQQVLITRTANRHLTPAYASPEQVRGEAVTTATDIYSLGVVLYCLLSGHRPYRLKQHTPAAIERAICEQEPESPSTVVDRVETEMLPDGTTVTITAENVSRARELPPEKLRRSLRGDLDNIVLKALQKEVQRRYRFVAELAQDIRRHLEHKPVLARRSTLAYRTSTFVLRHKTEVIATTLCIVISVGGIGFAVWAKYSSAARTREEIPSLRSQGRRSVAVLGFQNLSGQAETAWLSTALSEMLTTELAAGGKIRTIPGENVARIKRDLSLPETDSFSKQTLKRLYNNLGSDYVVVGSYLDKGNPREPVRYELQLQDAAIGETVASTVETGTEAGLADVVARFGADLRGKLGISAISAADSASVRASLPSNSEATRYYAEGLVKLRVFDAPAARDLLQKAVTADPDFALAHSALAETWTALGYDEKARQEAVRALDLSFDLSREDRLLIEARARETTHEWDRAAQIYNALFEFFPDNIDYGLKLVAARMSAGDSKVALANVDALHKLPLPLRDDPRIDLLESALSFVDPSREHAALLRMLQKAAASGADSLMAEAKLREANWLKVSGDLPGALSSANAARSFFTKLGDQNGIARAVAAMGDFYLRQGNRDAARGMYERQLAICRASGNEHGQADALGDLGTVFRFEGNLSAAENKIREELVITRKIQSKRDTADGLNDLTMLLIQRGDLFGSYATAQEAKAIYREIGDPTGVGLELSHTADVLYAEGYLAEAERTCFHSLKALRDTTDQHFTANVYSTLGKIQMAQGKLAAAQKDQEEGATIRSKIGEWGTEAQSKLYLATLAIEEERFKEAGQLARQAEEAFHKGPERYFEPYGHVVLAESLVGEGKLSDAQDLIDRALARSSEFVDIEVRLSIEIAAARVRAASVHFADNSRLSEATELLNSALSDAKSHGFVGAQLDARLALAEIKMKSGRLAEGRKELAALEHDAKAKGFMLIARKAATLRRPR